MEPELSIAISFCDVELHLEACLDSVVAQTFTDFEAGLVDDGSTDASSSIAKSYTLKDRWFRVIRQPNLGTGAVRNTDLREIRGKYVAFVDRENVWATISERFDVSLEFVDRPRTIWTCPPRCLGSRTSARLESGGVARQRPQTHHRVVPVTGRGGGPPVGVITRSNCGESRTAWHGRWWTRWCSPHPPRSPTTGRSLN